MNGRDRSRFSVAVDRFDPIATPFDGVVASFDEVVASFDEVVTLFDVGDSLRFTRRRCQDHLPSVSGPLVVGSWERLGDDAVLSSEPTGVCWTDLAIGTPGDIEPDCRGVVTAVFFTNGHVRAMVIGP